MSGQFATIKEASARLIATNDGKYREAALRLGRLAEKAGVRRCSLELAHDRWCARLKEKPEQCNCAAILSLVDADSNRVWSTYVRGDN